MKKVIIALLLFSGLLFACAQAENNTPIEPNDTIVPSLQCGGIQGKACPDGYVCRLEGTYPDAGGSCVLGPEDSCVQDSDCVRQANCCDCGVGQWVNKAYYNASRCTSEITRCMCVTQESHGECQKNHCVGVVDTIA